MIDISFQLSWKNEGLGSETDSLSTHKSESDALSLAHLYLKTKILSATTEVQLQAHACAQASGGVK